MLYTFAVLRSPLKLVPDVSGVFNHYLGGPLGISVSPSTDKIARVLTLDLKDPSLSFLRFPISSELPLLMDFSGGSIAYSIRPDGQIDIHSSAAGNDEPLLDGGLPRCTVRLAPFTYEQYRAVAFASTVIDDSYLSSDDRAALASLGDSYSQIGGAQLRGLPYAPYCSNPCCDGYKTLVMQPLATISQEPAPDISFDFLPLDPAIEYAFCLSCHSISGVIATD